MSSPDTGIMDPHLECRVAHQRFEAEMAAALLELQELRRRNKALEKELDDTRRLLIKAEKAIPSQVLPQELILEIAHILSSSHNYRTLGNLSLVSKAVHEDVVPVLFETMVCDDSWAAKMEGKEVGEEIRDKWKHTRFLVVSECRSLVDRRKEYFPNLQLGWTACDWDTASLTGLSSHLYIAGAVTMERLDQFLKLALLGDTSGRGGLGGSAAAIQTGQTGRIGEITLDPGADISPCVVPRLPEYPVCLLTTDRNHRGFPISFERATPAIRQAVERLFDLADPAFDSTQESVMMTRYNRPAVWFRISGGIEGLEEFVSIMESILCRHRALNVCIDVECNPSTLESGLAEGQRLLPHLETGYVAIMRAVKDVYLRQWSAMRDYRGLAHERCADVPFSLDFKVGPYPQSFDGFLGDDVEDLLENCGFYVHATYTDRTGVRVLLDEEYPGRGPRIVAV